MPVPHKRMLRRQRKFILDARASDVEALRQGSQALRKHINRLQRESSSLRDLYWSLFRRGVCSNRILAGYLQDQRGALTWRIDRLAIAANRAGNGVTRAATEPAMGPGNVNTPGSDVPGVLVALQRHRRGVRTDDLDPFAAPARLFPQNDMEE